MTHSTATTVDLLFFGGLKDVVGTSAAAFELEEARTVRALFDLLTKRYPAMNDYRQSVRVAVNGEYVGEGEPVKPGDEVALIPPVAGG